MSLWVWKQHAERGCEYMVLDRRASSRCTLGLDCYAPLLYNGSLDATSMILHLTSVFIEILHF